MLPADWQKIKQAFQSALEMDPSKLTDFLDSFRVSDPELFDELESLLRHRQQTGELFPDNAGLLHELDADERKRWIGRSIGPYNVVSILGEGGMGTVFQAIRVDDHYLKNVAIKVVRAAYATGPYLRRFKGERQILASLDHPNIAHLLDGGTTEEGLPYLVMESVVGKPIDEYCDTRLLSIEDRLRLILDVCSAVEYAHQKLVIHRDLKPANILVTADGVPKLLDFGIAKLLDPELYFQTATPDVTVARAMTPEYASPEQIRGDHITTASDVYALGVILYRLLTGHAPYVLHRTSSADWPRTVLETEPERPSTIVEKPSELTDSKGELQSLTPDEIARLRGTRTSALRRSLSGDLDNILQMALRKDPERRYASVEQFANDLRRSLEGLPVHARPDTITYRAGKFARRHRVPLAAVAIVLLSLTAGIFVAVRQARIAEQQRALAEHRFNDIQSVAHDLIFEIHDSIESLAGATPARKLVVQSALRYLDALSKDAPGNVDLEDEIATGYEKVGDVQGGIGRSNLGDTAGALESYKRALALRQAIYAARPGDAKAREGLSRSYMRMGDILEDMGRYQDALAYHQQHIELSKQLAAEQPDNARAQSHLAIAYDSIGATYGSVARWDESLAAYESSSAIFESLSKSHPNSTAYRRNWALERKKIGGALELRGDLARALKEDQFALETDEALAAQSPQDASAQRDVAIDLTNVGDVTSKLGNQTAAIEHYRRALAIDRKLALSDPKDASAQYYLAYDSYHLGDAQLRDAHPREAAVTFQQALARAEKSAHSDPENALLRSEVARIYFRLARAHVAAARLEAAATAAKRQRLTAARASYGKSLAIWSDLKKKGALRGPDLEEPEKVAEELKSCNKEMDEFS